MADLLGRKRAKATEGGETVDIPLGAMNSTNEASEQSRESNSRQRTEPVSVKSVLQQFSHDDEDYNKLLEEAAARLKEEGYTTWDSLKAALKEKSPQDTVDWCHLWEIKGRVANDIYNELHRGNKRTNTNTETPRGSGSSNTSQGDHKIMVSDTSPARDEASKRRPRSNRSSGDSSRKSLNSSFSEVLPLKEERALGRKPLPDGRLAAELEYYVPSGGENPITAFESTLATLSKNLGKTLDKSNIPLMATTGRGGSGKTEFFAQLRKNFDTVTQTVTDNGQVAPRGKVPDVLTEKVEQCVVAFATFNQGEQTHWSETDKKRTPVQSLTSRWAADLGWLSNPRKQILKDVSEISEFTQLLRSQVMTDTKTTEPSKIAVVLLVDELLKIDDSQRQAFLDTLAAAQQAELSNGLPTFTVVSSLELWSVADYYTTRSQRLVAALPLPRIPSDRLSALLNKKRELAALDDTQQRIWGRVVDVAATWTQGHPRTMERTYNTIMKQITKQPDKIDPHSAIKDSPNAQLAQYLWTFFRYQLCSEEECTMAVKDFDSDQSAKNAVEDQNLVASTIPTTSDSVKDFKYKLTVPPITFLHLASNRPDGNDATTSLPGRLVSSSLAMLKETNPAVLAKTWEKGIVGLLVLQALAWKSVKGHHPTLEQLLPGATFCNDAVKQFKINIDDGLALREAPTENLWPNQHQGAVFHSSNNSNEHGVQGFIEMMDQAGVRRKCGTQNKLWKSVSSGDVKEFADKATNRVDPQEDCVILFVTGDAQNCGKELSGTNTGNVILVGTSCLKRLLRPYGGNSLTSLVHEYTRPSLQGTERRHPKK